MITIFLKRYNKQVEVDMPAMYEELQLALWKLGLDRDPEKYTLKELNMSFRSQTPLEYFALRLLNENLTLLDAVSAIFSVIAPPHPVMAQVQILSSGFRSVSELRTEMDRLIENMARYGSTCSFPIQGVLMDAAGNMKEADQQIMADNAEFIGNAIQRMQKWIMHNMSVCFADTQTEAEESLFKKILTAHWSVIKTENRLYGRINLLLTDDLTADEEDALGDKVRQITTQDLALRAERWSVLTDQGLLYINFGSGEEDIQVGDEDDDEEILTSEYHEGCLCPACEVKLRDQGKTVLAQMDDVAWLDLLVAGEHVIPHPPEFHIVDDE